MRNKIENRIEVLDILIKTALAIIVLLAFVLWLNWHNRPLTNDCSTSDVFVGVYNGSNWRYECIDKPSEIITHQEALQIMKMFIE